MKMFTARQTKSKPKHSRPNKLRSNAARQLESLEDRRLMTADPLQFQAELPVVVDELAAMVQDADPQLVFEVQQADENQIFEFGGEFEVVDPDAWAQIIDTSEICDFGELLATSDDSLAALTDLVVLEFVEIENEQDIVAQLVDLIGAELEQQQHGDLDSLPPQLEQLRQELGDEGFSEWLHNNLEQTGTLQGISEAEIDRLRTEGQDEAVEQVLEIEDALQSWLDKSQEVNVVISGQQDDVWQIDGYEISEPGATSKSLPWMNLNTLEIEFGDSRTVVGNELQLFGSRPADGSPALAIPLTFLGQDGSVGTWVFDDLVDGYYNVELPGISPISFSVVGGDASEVGRSTDKVDFADFATLGTTFGVVSEQPNVHGADFNGDGIVGFGDFVMFAGRFGNSLPSLDFAPDFWSPESMLDCNACEFVSNVLPFMPIGNLNPNPPVQNVDPALVEGEQIQLNLLKSDGFVKPDGSFVVTKQVFVSSNDKFRVVKTVEEVQEGANKVKVKKTKTHVKKKSDPVGEFTTIIEKEYLGDQRNKDGEVIRPEGTKTSYESDSSKVTYQETRPDGSGHKTVTTKNVLNGEGTTKTTYQAGGGVKEVHVFTGGKWKRTK